jgi:hypothetical protein
VWATPVRTPSALILGAGTIMKITALIVAVAFVVRLVGNTLV